MTETALDDFVERRPFSIIIFNRIIRLGLGWLMGKAVNHAPLKSLTYILASLDLLLNEPFSGSSV